MKHFKFTKLTFSLTCMLLVLCFIFGACTPTSDTSDTSGAASSDQASNSSTVNAGNASSEVTSSTAETSSDTVSKQLYSPNLPKFKWTDKKEFRVLVLDNTLETTYFSEEVGFDKYDTTNPVINEAVKKRNQAVFDKYGVEIKAVYSGNVLKALNDDLKANMGPYDAAMPFFMQCITLAQNGYLYNLQSSTLKQYIHLDMPWWDQNATKAASIGNKVYFTTGDISFMQKKTSIAVYFDKKMLAEKFPDTDLYDTVKRGAWTFDKMVEMSKAVTKDTDGDSKLTHKDTWGLVSSYSDPVYFYISSGGMFIDKDQNNLPKVSYTSQDLDMLSNILKQFQSAEKWANFAQENDSDDIWKTSLDIFREGRALFRTSAFATSEKLTDYNLEYGIVPMPKYEESQEKYYTPCAASLAFGIAIPVSAPDPEFSAYMIEAMACEAKNYITDAYISTLAQSSDDKEMLDVIFDNTVYEADFIYMQAYSKVINFMKEKTADAKSLLNDKESIQQKVSEIIEKVNKTSN